MKLITFDFWNTLFLDQNEGHRNARRMAFALEKLRTYRQSLTPEDIERAFGVASVDFNTQWTERTSCDMNRYVGVMLQTLQMTIPDEDRRELVHFFETILLEFQPKVVPNAAEAIHHASSLMKVGLISDTGYSPGTTLRKILGVHQLEDRFHSFSFSNETGYLKPRPETFRRILDELGIEPENGVHIGDLEDTDIAGAKQIGMKAIKFIGANPEAKRESVADAVIEDLSELPSALDRLL
jgi:HAD superfamily hydrolase (TIGR01549 family)